MAGARTECSDAPDDDHAALSLTYDAALRDLDEATGLLVDGLAQRGRLDDTVLVIVSDHGEHLGEGGRYEHRWSVEELLRQLARKAGLSETAWRDARLSVFEAQVFGEPRPTV